MTEDEADQALHAAANQLGELDARIDRAVRVLAPELAGAAHQAEALGKLLIAVALREGGRFKVSATERQAVESQTLTMRIRHDEESDDLWVEVASPQTMQRREGGLVGPDGEPVQ